MARCCARETKDRCHDPADRPGRSAQRRRRRARAGAVAGQAAAQLLLAGAVHSAGHDGPVVRGVHAVGRRADIQHGRLALAPANRADAMPAKSRIRRRLRPSAGRRAGRPQPSSSRATTARPSSSGATTSQRQRTGADRERRREPRAPHLAGRRQVVFVSTAGTGHFNLKIADLSPAGLSNERYLVAPRESTIDRYYYSTHDHFINPSWSPDGKRVWFVTNTEIPWGTGWICSVAVAGGEPAMPRQAPARNVVGRAPGSRPGRKAHPVLELSRRPVAPALADDRPTTSAPLPLTYGEFDRRNARWSPDGRRIAYISNKDGNTSLWVLEVFGGARRQVSL